jgi:hypothetical protein
MNVFNTKQKNKNMKHAREDYNRIQDPANLIPEDEPVFLLRAQDGLYTDALQNYLSLLYEYHASAEMIYSVRAHIKASIVWRNKNPDRIKTPDLPKPEKIFKTTPYAYTDKYVRDIIEKYLENKIHLTDLLKVLLGVI